MKEDIDILQLIKDSPNGNVKLKKKIFVFLPKNKRGEDMPDYKCSRIVSIMKYNERKINVSFVDLPKTYNGEKINLADDDSYPWHYININPIQLMSYRMATNWDEM